MQYRPAQLKGVNCSPLRRLAIAKQVLATSCSRTIPMSAFAPLRQSCSNVLRVRHELGWLPDGFLAATLSAVLTLVSNEHMNIINGGRLAYNIFLPRAGLRWVLV